MVYFFYTATSKFIELLLYKKDQQCNRRIVRTVNVLVIILIICKSIGSHIFENGFYLYKLIIDRELEGRKDTEDEFSDYLNHPYFVFFDRFCVYCQNILHFLIGCIFLTIYFKLGSNQPLFHDI